MKRYVISLRREQRESDAPCWSEPLRAIDGLFVRGTAGGQRIQVDATDEAIAEARRLLGDLCHIEPAISRRLL